MIYAAIRILPPVLFLFLMSALCDNLLAQTLREVLRENGMDLRRANLVDLDKAITSYAVLHEGKEFCIGYYLFGDSSELSPAVTVVLFNEAHQRWISRRISFDSLAVRPGSILAIHRTKNFFCLDSHINPSAGLLIILTDRLKYHDVVYGWFLGAYSDETVVYHNNQIHFAPTHYTEISIYNPHTRSSRMIYPLKPFQEIRLAHTAKVKAAYGRKGEEWFRTHNHHMNPELFNDRWNDRLSLSDKQYALAFTIGFDNTEYWSDDERLKLESFMGLRTRLTGQSPSESLEDALFMSLYEDLMRVKNLNESDAVLDLFRSDTVLQPMIKSVLDASVQRNGTSWRAYLVSLDPRWGEPEYWHRLSRAIVVPGDESTEVLYVYRHVDDDEHIEYKEMLLPDAKARFGDVSLSVLLEPAVLNRIFGTN
jgi:hypothetical protein